MGWYWVEVRVGLRLGGMRLGCATLDEKKRGWKGKWEGEERDKEEKRWCLQDGLGKYDLNTHMTIISDQN